MEENQPSDVAIELIAIKTITAFIGVMGRIIRLRNSLIILYKSSRVKRLTLVELLSLLGVFGSCQKKLFTHFSVCLCFFLRVRFLFLLGVSERGEEAPCVHARIPSLTAPLSLLRGCGKKKRTNERE